MKTVLFFLFTSLTLISCTQKTKIDIVDVTGGKISGLHSGDLHIYKGIPFAAPPIGALRWKEPQELKSWEGIKECIDFSASPIQRQPEPFACWSEEFISPPDPLSEDCLYLNVWTEAKSSEEKRPVFVWIYGGGFNSGSAACAIYDGESYAKKGVVFVSINYRVGPFGFMAHPELSKEQNGASGNYGLLDQVAALKWVKENIGKFGGDPGNVTIGGQSAGSMSVHALMASPLAKGLFHKAVAMSGGFGPSRIPGSLKDAENLGMELQKLLGANNLADLRTLKAEDIQKMSGGIKGGRMGVITDGYLLPENAFENRINQVPVLTGWTKDDGGFLSDGALTLNQYITETKEQLGNKAEEFLSVFTAKNDEEAMLMRTKAKTLSFAGIPAHLLGSNNSKSVYVYEVNHVPTDKPDFPHYGAFHTSDVPFALANLETWDRPWADHDRKVEAVLSSYYLNFIKSGNPNGENLPKWYPYSSDTQSIQVINEETSNTTNRYKAEFSVLN